MDEETPQVPEEKTELEGDDTHAVKQTRLSGNALLAFVCGLLLISFGAVLKLVLAPAALFFAYKAHVEYKAQPEVIKTYGLDLIGGLLGLIVIIAFIYTLIK